MGTDFDYFGPESAARYYEDNFVVTDAQVKRDNRRTLFSVMTDAGFSGYDEEWWHFDFGNQFDAARKDKSYAIYGRISLAI